MARLHGKNAQIWLNGTQLTSKTTWRLAKAREYADVSVYGDLGKTFAVGLPAYDGSFAGFLEVGGEYALSVAAMTVPVTVDLYAEAGTLIATGPAYVDIEASADVNDAVRIGGTIRGSGAWTLG